MKKLDDLKQFLKDNLDSKDEIEIILNVGGDYSELCNSFYTVWNNYEEYNDIEYKVKAKLGYNNQTFTYYTTINDFYNELKKLNFLSDLNMKKLEKEVVKEGDEGVTFISYEDAVFDFVDEDRNPIEMEKLLTTKQIKELEEYGGINALIDDVDDWDMDEGYFETGEILSIEVKIGDKEFKL